MGMNSDSVDGLVVNDVDLARTDMNKLANTTADLVRSMKAFADANKDLTMIGDALASTVTAIDTCAKKAVDVYENYSNLARKFSKAVEAADEVVNQTAIDLSVE